MVTKKNQSHDMGGAPAMWSCWKKANWCEKELNL